MNWTYVERNWTSLRSFAGRVWLELTDDDLCRIEGDRLVLIGRIQSRYSIARAEAERQVNEWARGL